MLKTRFTGTSAFFIFTRNTSSILVHFRWISLAFVSLFFSLSPSLSFSFPPFPQTLDFRARVYFFSFPFRTLVRCSLSLLRLFVSKSHAVVRSVQSDSRSIQSDSRSVQPGSRSDFGTRTHASVWASFRSLGLLVGRSVRLLITTYVNQHATIWLMWFAPKYTRS